MRRRLGTWLLGGLMATGCATTGTLQNGIYKGAETSYSIGPVGPDWRRVSVSGQNDLAWHNSSKMAVMHVDSRCDPSLDIPLTALRAHLMIGFTEREVLSEETIPMDGREALRTHFTANLDGVPREVLMQILKKDDCVYDFALVTPPGLPFESALGDFDALVNGFHTISENS